MITTCSFHHGTEYVPGHNRREKKAEKEAHIDENGIHFTWVDENLSDAYDRLFGEALAEYNAKQKRKDRKIKSYLQNVRENSKLRDVYECIVQVGNEKNHPDEIISRQILQDYLKEFQEKNPSLSVIGAYYHADEVGETPHLHLDYIPVAQGKKTGLKVRNNLTEALKTLGYDSEYVEDTKKEPNPKTGKPYLKLYSAEMKFQEAERIRLAEISKKYGIEIQNPHLAPEEYSTSKQLRQARTERIANEKKEQELKQKEAEINNAIEHLKERFNELQTNEKQLANNKSLLDEKDADLSHREAQITNKENYYKQVDEVANKIRDEVSTYDLRQNDKEILPAFGSDSLKIISSPENIKDTYKPKFGEKNQDFAYRVVKHVYEWARKTVAKFQDKYNALKDELFNTKYTLAKERGLNRQLKSELDLYDYRKKTPEELEQIARTKRQKQQKKSLDLENKNSYTR